MGKNERPRSSIRSSVMPSRTRTQLPSRTTSTSVENSRYVLPFEVNLTGSPFASSSSDAVSATRVPRSVNANSAVMRRPAGNASAVTFSSPITCPRNASAKVSATAGALCAHEAPPTPSESAPSTTHPRTMHLRTQHPGALVPWPPDTIRLLSSFSASPRGTRRCSSSSPSCRAEAPSLPPATAG